jgi:hypothetical protein
MKDFDRLSFGEKVTGISAVLLFIFMYLDWFAVNVSGPGGSANLGGANAWQALDITPLVLAATVVLSLLSVALRISNLDYEPPISANAGIIVLGGISAVLILFQIVNPPSLGQVSGLALDATLRFGIFLALIAAVGISLGGYMAMREEAVAPSDVSDGMPSAN